jgi:hypothetical protein
MWYSFCFPYRRKEKRGEVISIIDPEEVKEVINPAFTRSKPKF